MTTFTYAGEVLHVESLGTFHTGEPAWSVVTASGDHRCRLSVNLGFPPRKGDRTLFWLKAWSENAEVASAAMAQAVGVRADIWAMAVPSLIFEVWAPIHASGVNTSLPQDSAVHTES